MSAGRNRIVGSSTEIHARTSLKRYGPVNAQPVVGRRFNPYRQTIDSTIPQCAEPGQDKICVTSSVKIEYCPIRKRNRRSDLQGAGRDAVNTLLDCDVQSEVTLDDLFRET